MMRHLTQKMNIVKCFQKIHFFHVDFSPMMNILYVYKHINCSTFLLTEKLFYNHRHTRTHTYIHTCKPNQHKHTVVYRPNHPICAYATDSIYPPAAPSSSIFSSQYENSCRHLNDMFSHTQFIMSEKVGEKDESGWIDGKVDKKRKG